MYWTDWGNDPKIERADLDGRNRLGIIEENLGWPNGLTIDRPSSKLIWADALTEVSMLTLLSKENQSLLFSPFSFATWSRDLGRFSWILL